MAPIKPSRSTTLIKEIETYREHCLYAEARKRAVELANLILENERLRHKKKLLMAVVDRIEAIEEEAEAFAAVGKGVRLSKPEQQRIRRVFSSAFEPGSDAAAHEGAIALLVFGQFATALAEFEKLQKSREFRIPAAKNIIRCLLGLGETKKAVQRYLEWLSSPDFAPEPLEVIRAFLQRALERKGISRRLPKPKLPEPPATAEAPPIELTLELLSIAIPIEDDEQQRRRHSLDVTFQRGRTISAIVSGKERDLLKRLKPGTTLNEVMFDATDLTYYASCVVYANSTIRVGEKKGDHTVTFKLLDR
jgi:hypothetical protein